MTQEPTDEELAERFQAGDTSAYSVLFQRYYDTLYKYLVSLVGVDYADDLTQDVFFKALHMPEDLRCFKAWLYRVAKNLSKDHWKHASLIRWLPWEERKELCENGHIFTTSPEQEVEEADHISRAMAQVSPKYRPCLHLDIFEDMRQREIAALLAIPERTVRRHISEGKKQLYKAYKCLKDQQATE